MAKANPSTAKAPAKKAPATKKAPAAAKAPAKKAPAPAAKAPAKKAPAAKAPAKKAPAAAKAPAKKAPAPAAKAPAKKAPAAAKAPAKAAGSSPFSAAFIEQQREALLSERARYMRQATSLREEADSLMVDTDPGDVQFDEESGDANTVAVERDRDLALSAQALSAVEEINAALERIEAGTYGICTASGEPIPKERLEAIPWAAVRVEYKVGGFGHR